MGQITQKQLRFFFGPIIRRYSDFVKAVLMHFQFLTENRLDQKRPKMALNGPHGQLRGNAHFFHKIKYSPNTPNKGSEQNLANVYAGISL